MFSTSEQFSRAARALFDNQAALFEHGVHALFDAGTHATEANAETFRTLIASTTVAVRQWLGAGGAYDWLTVAAHQPYLGWTGQTALPAGARHRLVSGPAMAV